MLKKANQTRHLKSTPRIDMEDKQLRNPRIQSLPRFNLHYLNLIAKSNTNILRIDYELQYYNRVLAFNAPRLEREREEQNSEARERERERDLKLFGAQSRLVNLTSNKNLKHWDGMLDGRFFSLLTPLPDGVYNLPNLYVKI